MKKKYDCVPLKLLRKIGAEYPKAWEQMDYVRSLHGKETDMNWPDWCWVPMSAAVTVVMAEHNIHDIGDLPNRYGHDVQAISALAPWRHSKQVYLFDATLEDDMVDDLDAASQIPSDALKMLPFFSVYIKVNHISVFGYELDGFFSHLEYDVNSHDSELRFLTVSKDGNQYDGFSVHIDEPTIELAFQRFMKIGIERSRAILGDRATGVFSNPIFQKETEVYLKDSEEICRKLLPMVLYLCLDNSDIVYHPTVHHSTSSGVIKDRYSEIQTWNVGYRIGPAIKRYYDDQAKREGHPGSHTSKRPHVRRAHYQHYWVGSGDSKHLILKRISEIFVNVNKEDDLPVTIHKT